MPPGPFSPLLERTAPSGCVVNVSPNDVLNIRGYPSSVSRMTYPIVYFEDLALDIPVRGRGAGRACDAQELRAGAQSTYGMERGRAAMATLTRSFSPSLKTVGKAGTITMATMRTPLTP